MAAAEDMAPDLVTSQDMAAPEDMSGADMASQAPMIGDALDCTPRRGSGVTPGADLVKLTLDAPGAVCNDGSPAVMYVRRAATSAGSGRWVFHLQGGGTCDARYEECSARWCDRNEKMSSAGTPEGMKASGLMNRSAANRLGDANQVFIYYCSSDNWAGQADDITLSAEGQPSLRMHSRGHTIVEAALAALERGATSDDGSQRLPKLTDAEDALLTGTSAGCGGVTHNADWFASRMAGHGARPWIVCDANFGPSYENLPDGAAEDAYRAARALRYQSATAMNPYLDQSCLAAHPQDPGMCHFTPHVLANHINEAPLFLRMDLADNSILDGYRSVGFELSTLAPATRKGLLDAAAGIGEEETPRPISVYGPACRQHVGLTNDDWFNVATITYQAREVTLHDAIVAWMGGEDIAAVDTAPASLSQCAQTTSDAD